MYSTCYCDIAQIDVHGAFVTQWYLCEQSFYHSYCKRTLIIRLPFLPSLPPFFSFLHFFLPIHILHYTTLHCTHPPTHPSAYPFYLNYSSIPFHTIPLCSAYSILFRSIRFYAILHYTILHYPAISTSFSFLLLLLLPLHPIPFPFHVCMFPLRSSPSCF